MRGPIDYIIVGFEGNKFDGSILKALNDAIEKGIIGLIDLALVKRDEDDTISVINVSDLGDEYAISLIEQHKQDTTSKIDEDDINEVADLIEKNCAAGLLIIEHLWAKPLKEAIINANGVLLAEGRIHPDAAEELN
ncbi:MAG: DUF6325 family protein [Candidatus Saccharimonadales bacterium]